MRRLHLLVLELKAAATRVHRRVPRTPLEEVLEASARRRAPGHLSAEAARPEAERFEHALAAEAAAGSVVEALETLEARLALSVDLATVERLSLLDVTEDLVRGIDLGEAAGSLGVVLVRVRMQLLGQLAERAFDVRGARALGHSQHVIGVAHF
jgi:hypothetical protein